MLASSSCAQQWRLPNNNDDDNLTTITTTTNNDSNSHNNGNDNQRSLKHLLSLPVPYVPSAKRIPAGTYISEAMDIVVFQ